jgi:hypothetical protein
MHNLLIASCILHFAFCIGCSIPNLEPQSCIDSRTPIREFYSFHFGNDMNFSHENLEKREPFLTPEFVSRLTQLPDGADPFTTGDTDYPKAFRVGECKEITPDKTEFQVLVFWKDDVRSEQREARVITVNRDDRWLIDSVAAARKN